jgi:predicted lipoprotein with Yx(FWY)xxD motif
MKCSIKRRPFVARATEPRRELNVRRLIAPPTTPATLTLALVAVALMFSSSASAQTSSCADAVTSAPTGQATVSAASTSFGRVLVVGSGAYTGCSLYVLTSDQLHALSGAAFGCSDNANVLGLPCDTVLWPALLTKGAPIAGTGVNPTLLGTVTRTDLPGIPSVQQVTYAGQPLYRFFLDETPGETEGANLDDPVTSPAGIWYLVEPSRGRPAPGQAQLQLETAPVGGAGPNQTVLAATMNDDFSVFPNASFPVYTLNTDTGHESACQGTCSAVYWPPVLTSKRPEAGPGVDQHALGIIVRPDGTHQVTYNGKPVYLFNNDAYIAGITGTMSINGAGADTPWGAFNTIPPLP